MDASIDCLDSCFFEFCHQYRSRFEDSPYDWELDKKYGHKLKHIEENFPRRKFKFGFGLPYGSNNKRLYYKLVIENVAWTFLNAMHTKIQGNPEKEIKTMLVQACLHVLEKWLDKVAKIATDQKLHPFKYKPGRKDKVGGHPEGNDAWVLDCFRHQLICLYLEIQAHNAACLSHKPYSEDYLFCMFFQQDSTHLIYRIAPEKIKQTPAQSGDINGGSFVAIKKDFRAPEKEILSYDKIIKKPEQFSRIEQELYNQGLLNNDYNFMDIHGNQTKIARIICILHSNGFFHERIHPGNKKISLLTIRKFFDNRYKMEINRPFLRAFHRKEKNIEFIEKNFWIEQLFKH